MEEAGNDLEQRLIPGISQPERPRNGGKDEIGRGEHRQGDKYHPIGEPRRRFLPDAQGEASLADPSGTGQGHEPRLFAQGREDRRHVSLATDQ